MAIVRLNTNLITDWASFHLVCKEAFGFPEFSGRNMDAWIDCMSSISEKGEMTKFALREDERLNIEITETENFKIRLPDIFEELIECTAIVNKTYVRHGEIPKIALVFL